MNLVVISGRLGKDPEVTKTTTGKSVVNISIAIDDYKPSDENTKGNWQQCQFWNNAAEYLADNASKGDKIVVQGRLSNESWEDNDGNTRYKNCVIVSNWEFEDKVKGNKTVANKSIKPKEMTSEEYSTEDTEDLPF